MEDGVKILDEYLRMIFKFGIRSVTLDDLASELGISKKTIYEKIGSKEELVEQTSAHFLSIQKKNIRGILKKNLNPVKEFLAIGSNVLEFIREMNPSVIFDLQRYYPKSWDLYKQYKGEFVFSVMAENIERGRKMGLFRKGFDPRIIIIYYISRMEVILEPSVFPRKDFNVPDILREIQIYHLRGISTSEGLKLLETELDTEI